jgi:hypothetical protein
VSRPPETLRPTRECIDGVYCIVHVSADGRIRVNMGRDDQRPDHDGRHYFQPICVEQRVVGGGLYDYHKYCGACRKRMGHLGEVKEHCPRCGKGVAHYVFEMGTEVYQARDWDDSLPDVWPVATIAPVVAMLPPAPEDTLA